MKMKRLLGIAIATSLAVMLVACSGTGGSGATTASGGASTTAASEAGTSAAETSAPAAEASTAAGEESSEAATGGRELTVEELGTILDELPADFGAGKKVGLAQMHYTNAFRTAETDSVLTAFEEKGFEVVWNEAGNDTATQISNVENLLAQDIDYLLLPPKEEEGLVPALEAAKEAGVPVILLDRSANGTPGEDYVTAIRSDAIAEGEWCAEWIIEQFGEEPCNVVEIFGAPGSTTAMDRSKGFMNLIDQHDNIVLLESQVGNNMRSEAQVCMENLYQAHGDQIDVVVTHSDEMTFGVLQALDGAGVTPGEDILVLSIGDGSSNMLDEIINGRVAACSECTPLLGPQALQVVGALELNYTVPGWIVANDRFFTIENAEAEKTNAGW